MSYNACIMNIINHQLSKIILDQPIFHWTVIWLIFLAASMLSIRQRPTRKPDDFSATLQLKGLAIYFLLIGHVSIHVLQVQTKLSQGGYWAVMMFLFFSGYSLAKRYSSQVSSKIFWSKRFNKIYPLMWVSIGFFIITELAIRGAAFPIEEIVVGMLGWYQTNNFTNLNAAGWYISFQLFWYLIFDMIRRIKPLAAFAVMFEIGLFLLVLIWYLPAGSTISIWSRYVFIFPLGYIIGVYWQKIIRYLKILNEKKLSIPTFAVSGFIFWYNREIFNKLIRIFNLSSYESVLSYLWNTTISLPFLIMLLIAWYIFRRRPLESKWLKWLGANSYAIYLFHLPLMVKYDAILYREPFGLYFWVYLIAVLFVANSITKLISFKTRTMVREAL